MHPPPIHLDTSNNQQTAATNVASSDDEWARDLSRAPGVRFYFFIHFLLLLTHIYNQIDYDYVYVQAATLTCQITNETAGARDAAQVILFLYLLFISLKLIIYSLYAKPLPPRNSKKGPTTRMGSEGLGWGLETGRVSSQSLFSSYLLYFWCNSNVLVATLEISLHEVFLN
jgi:hypothetical protein